MPQTQIHTNTLTESHKHTYTYPSSLSADEIVWKRKIPPKHRKRQRGEKEKNERKTHASESTQQQNESPNLETLKRKSKNAQEKFSIYFRINKISFTLY